MARSPLVYQIYAISKLLPSYTFMDVVNMPYILKELLYQLISNDYSTDKKDSNYIDLDNDDVNLIEKALGEFKNERKQY